VKVGDLVKFHSSSWVTDRDDYKNPGIIIEHVAVIPNRFRILWADQRVTVEHVSYLKPLTSS